MSSTPTLLIILDGFGTSKQQAHNAIQLANTPILDQLWERAPHVLLQASGHAVELPDGQMGNSEVGHLHIGAGRPVPQDLTRINQAILNGDFFKNTTLKKAIELCRKNNAAAHVIGLLSPGGVHSEEKQIAAMIDMIHRAGIKQNYFHAILDGRDTPPQSAQHSIDNIHQQYQSYNSSSNQHAAKIASMIGRYYAMDRNNHWDRIEKAYRLLTEGHAQYHVDSPQLGLQQAYQHHLTDEFVPPISIHQHNESPITLKTGDVLFFMNFRADRARELSHALIDQPFHEFKRPVFPKLNKLITLTTYATHLKADVAFPPFILKNTLGDYLSQHHYRQLRIAETEKYAHITYFLNGGIESPFPKEDRILIPSPEVSTYDQQPNMSAIAITDQLIDAIKQHQYDFIVCNFANPDMVGHTGNQAATQQAIECVDTCLGRIIQALTPLSGEALITADHGNAEKMYDAKTKQAHTAHTTNPVPLIYVGNRHVSWTQASGILADIAPTLLYLMGLPIPTEMTGHPLLQITP